MSHSGSIKIHSKEEAEALLKLYKPLLEEAEGNYLRLKNTVNTLKIVLNDNARNSDTPPSSVSRSVEWNPSNWADRIFLSLDIIGRECLSRDIAEIVIAKEPSINRKTAGKSLSSALWSLEQSGEIIRRRDDNNRKLISLPEWIQKK